MNQRVFKNLTNVISNLTCFKSLALLNSSISHYVHLFKAINRQNSICFKSQNVHQRHFLFFKSYKIRKDCFCLKPLEAETLKINIKSTTTHDNCQFIICIIIRKKDLTGHHFSSCRSERELFHIGK